MDIYTITGNIFNCIFLILCILLWISYYKRKNEISQRMIINFHFTLVCLAKNILFFFQLINNPTICKLKRSFNVSATDSLNLFFLLMVILVFLHTLYPQNNIKLYSLFNITAPLTIWFIFFAVGLFFFFYSTFNSVVDSNTICWSGNDQLFQFVNFCCNLFVYSIIITFLCITIGYIIKYREEIRSFKMVVLKLITTLIMICIFITLHSCIYYNPTHIQIYEMIQRPVLLAFLLLQVIDKATVNELKNFLCIEEKRIILKMMLNN